MPFTQHLQHGCDGFYLALALIAKNNTFISGLRQDAGVPPVIKIENDHKKLGTPQKEGAHSLGAQLAAS